MQPSDPPSAPARRAVPRPPDHRAGSAAPWAALSAGDRRSITLDRVRAGVGASRTEPPADADPRAWSLAGRVVEGEPAAVLVALFEEDGEARVILTVRSDRLRSHQGEVAFPGGRLDDGEGVVAGALREAFEEVDLAPQLVTVVGELTPMPTLASNTVMTPVVATLDARPGLVPNPGEVERVFDVALSELAADGVFHEEWWPAPRRPASAGLPEGEFPVWFFELAGETVWGATARTLVELICWVLGVVAPPSLQG
jgi:8-oxo-dGTP pyrophosphatase MutT (NUDIX family)